ncbi:iron complex transport system ATP-binding protein [Clostridium collagenovorans DSM 3089]|uniref:Iron complex transport system ATP-binding protein n=1 Tax=Clostridium collagenovorans DSM 3089 TaxID=1121306 RepID=A0A1M5Y3D4_9CLOT|nr:ABC transporter ATP-binding protein [Clostridium collagenovorans]SHI06314.1 iron complex transport system ATP-binding protein [Clostridium collagenovorans DSM 3089]
MIMLNTENLNVGYGKKIVVDNVNIQVNRGEVLCLLGANGAGKTTTLRTLSGLLKPMGGKVFLKGQDIDKINKKELAKKLALVLTNRFSGSLMTVYDIVAMGRHPHTGFFGKLTEDDTNKIFSALEIVNARYLAERYFDELSDGEKQKVLVARALVQEPEIIILDEPTTHLDIKHRLELMDILKTLSKKKDIAVILSLHEIDIALKSCDKVMLIKNNKVLAYGEPEDTVDENIINGLYGLNENNFNNLLGSVELSNLIKKRVFVVGGNGMGTPIYRALTKKEIGICSGVLHENDIDYEIGRTIGIKMTTMKAFESITTNIFNKALEDLYESEVLIDSGFPVGELNIKNVELVKIALSKGKKVFSLRNIEEGKEIFKDLNKQIIYKRDISQIIKEITKKDM